MIGLTENAANPMARLQVEVSEELKTLIKIEAAKQNRTMSEIVESCLLKCLKVEGK